MPGDGGEANSNLDFKTHPAKQLRVSPSPSKVEVMPSARSRRGWEAARLFDTRHEHASTTTHDERACAPAATVPSSSKEGGGLLLGSYARYPETMADSAIAQAEGVSRTTIWRRRQKQLARLDGELSGTSVRERNVRNRKGMRRATSEEVV